MLTSNLTAKSRRAPRNAKQSNGHLFRLPVDLQLKAFRQQRLKPPAKALLQSLALIGGHLVNVGLGFRRLRGLGEDVEALGLEPRGSARDLRSVDVIRDFYERPPSCSLGRAICLLPMHEKLLHLYVFWQVRSLVSWW